MAWIGDLKAFDKVPHSLIFKSLESLGINNKVIIFIKKTITTWKTRFRNRRYKNIIWAIPRRLIITTVIFHLFNTSY